MIKILKEANKFKETLSANKEASFFVENLYDGIDLRSSLSRVEFEKMCQPMF
jgi:hypoxia up-regulated 1